MLKTHLISLFFQYIPEDIALTFVASVFLKINTQKVKVISIGAFVGIITFIIRLLPISFGFHTILSMIVLTVLLSIFFRVNGFKSFIAALKTYILLAVIEMISINTFIYLTGYTMEDMNQNPVIRTIAVLPQIIILFAVGLIIKYFYNKKSLEG